MGLRNLANDEKPVILHDMDTEAAIKIIQNIQAELAQLLESLAENTPVFPIEKMKLVEAKICLNCEKPLETKGIRGTHSHCYRQITRSIEDGEITNNDAITLGLLLPKEKSGRKPLPNALRRAIRENKKRVIQNDVNEAINDFKSKKKKPKND